MDESCHTDAPTRLSHHTADSPAIPLPAHISTSHVTHMNHTYESFISHIWMSSVTHTDESRHTYAPASLSLRTTGSPQTPLPAAHMDESCHTYELVASHIWMRCVTRMDESCHAYKYVILHI